MQRKAERVLKLIEDESFLKEERARERKLTAGIKGFGSFCQQPISTDNSSNDSKSEKYLRWNSHFCIVHSQEDAVLTSDSKTWPKPAEGLGEECIDATPGKPAQYPSTNRSHEDYDHPFYEKKHQSLVALLSSR